MGGQAQRAPHLSIAALVPRIVISQIEAQASMLSAAVVNVEFLGVMQQAQEAHKQVQEHVNVESERSRPAP